jgi:hypothetical protein
VKSVVAFLRHAKEEVDQLEGKPDAGERKSYDNVDIEVFQICKTNKQKLLNFSQLKNTVKVAEYTWFLFEYLYKKCINHKVQHV